MEYVGISVHITTALDRYLGEDFIDFRKLGGGELNFATRDILQVALLVSVSLCSLNHPREKSKLENVRGSGEGNDVRSKRGDPGNCELARSDSLLLREGLHGLDEGEVVLEVFRLESREATTHVVRYIGKPVRS